MLFTLLVFLQIISGIITGESSIRATPQGRITLDRLKTMGYFFLNWRVKADCHQELRKIGIILGFSSLALVFFLAIFGVTFENEWLRQTPGILLVLGISISIFQKGIKGNLKEMWLFVLLFSVTPLGIYILDNYSGYQFNFYQHFAQSLAYMLGVPSVSMVWVVIIITIISIVVGIVGFIFSTIVLSIIPLFLLFIIVLTSTLSQKILKSDPTRTYYLASIYCFLIGPILVALESKGII